jgi:Domain of unknown function (DUF6458)
VTIGVGIFLLALGAILAFAVTDRISGIDLTAVGYILMGAAALGMVLTLVLSNRRRRESPLDPVVEEEYRIEERHRTDE